MKFSRYLMLLSVLLFFMFYGFTKEARANSVSPDDAASQIVDAIASQDRNAFEKLFFTENDLPTDSDYDYYFGLEAPSRLRSFFLNSNIDHSIFYQNDNAAVIVFFRGELVDNLTDLDWSCIGNHWLELYAVTEIVKRGNIWYFDGTPFYLFRHAPWTDDYG